MHTAWPTDATHTKYSRDVQRIPPCIGRRRIRNTLLHDIINSCKAEKKHFLLKEEKTGASDKILEKKGRLLATTAYSPKHARIPGEAPAADGDAAMDGVHPSLSQKRPFGPMFYSGALMLSWLFFMMLLCSIGFRLGISVGVWAVVLAAACSIASVAVLSFTSCDRPSPGVFLHGTLIAVLACAASLACASLFVDLSSDGLEYHKTAVAALAGGWNPVQSSVVEWERYGVLYHDDPVSVWIDHYPHGLWSIEACVYAMTGFLETAKGVKLVAACAFGFLLGSYVRKRGLSCPTSAFVATAAVLNPITVAQFWTFYNDDFLMMVLLSLVLALAMLADIDLASSRALVVFLVVCAFFLCVGTKFTGLAYGGVFTCAFSALYLVLWLRKKASFTGSAIGGIAGVFVLMLVASIVTVGWSSYVTNTLEDGNPFFPIRGEGGRDIITNQQPPSFEDSSQVRKLAYGFFGACDILPRVDGARTEPHFKFPLSVSGSELESLRYCDVRIGGFGPLYGATLFLGIPLYLVCLVWSWRAGRHHLFAVACTFGVTVVGLLLFVSDSWWARYSSYVYAMNIVVLVFLAMLVSSNRSAGRHGASAVLTTLASFAFSALLVVNMGAWIAFGAKVNYEQGNEARATVASIKDSMSGGSMTLDVSYAWGPGTLYLLDDEGISYTITSNVGQAQDADGRLGTIAYKLVRNAAF